MKVLIAAAVLVLATALPAHASEMTVQYWDQTGAEHLPCPGGANWVLQGEVTDPIMVIEDSETWASSPWPMTSDGTDFTVTTPVEASDTVMVAFSSEPGVQPTLSLVDCVQAVTAPPVTPPTESVPTLPPTQSQVHWEIGFTVHTIRPTNVSVHLVLRCSNGTETQTANWRFKARTPVVRHYQPTLVDATSCHIHVVSWDIPPHTRPHNWPAPVVETWAEVAP